jgi:hypothetical protein
LDLSLKIEDWLVAVVADTEVPEWVWGREIFWLSFVAAYPLFPHGDWRKWNATIPLDGPFIQSWMETAHRGLTLKPVIGSVDERRILSSIWSQFQHFVSSFCPHVSIANNDL